MPSTPRFFSVHLFLLAITVIFASPALATEVQKRTNERDTAVTQKKPAAQNAAKPTSVAMKNPPAAKAVPGKGAKSSADTPERLQQDLDSFAKKCVISMNSQLRPGLHTKEVAPHPNGGYVARYMVVDADSLQTSYNPAENKYVQYVGKMIYHEVEYSSTGTTKEQALAGPFNEVNRVPVTELIKYMKGKWTY